MPSLRSVSDSQSMNPNSTSRGVLGSARNPPLPSSSFARGGAMLKNDAMAKALKLQQERMQLGGMTPPNNSPSSPAMSAASSPAFGGMRPTPNLQRPGPGMHVNSAPTLGRQSLSERRAGAGMTLSGMGGGSPSLGPTTGISRPNAPKLPGMSLPGPVSSAPSASSGLGSKLDDFKQYIDAEKGWITFDGAATITREGVNFSNGKTFRISLDEIETLGELGKGNYGTVYKVRHSKPKAPRFGQGLSGTTAAQMEEANKEPATAESGTTTGKVMAMKEIRLELDDAKFTTILKELVILHECVSPYIIDFYGAFFQEGGVYICIEYMDGGSIDKLYAGGIPEGVLRKITHSTVLGLKSLKDEHNIIHRDVKPTNILINTRGQTKICDFGVSGNLVASIAKTNIGCQSYMAPERISGGGMAQSGNSSGTYSVQSDVWSLGLTIIECAMGQYPYPAEVSSTIFSQLSAIVEGEPPGLPEEGYSDVAKDFVKSCVRKIPKQRPTYAALLKHPWLSSLSKPVTIAEEPEDGAADPEAVAEAVDQLNISDDVVDQEVADWVKSVLQAKKDGSAPKGADRPALHAAPLDSMSPLNSPVAVENE